MREKVARSWCGAIRLSRMPNKSIGYPMSDSESLDNSAAKDNAKTPGGLPIKEQMIAPGQYPPGFDPDGYHAQLFGPWRDGKRLVVLKNEPLPARCVKSNEPTDYRLRQKLTWHPLIAQLTGFAGFLGSFVAYKMLEQKIVLEVPLSKRFRIRRWLWIGLGILFILGGIAIIMYPMVQRNPVKNWGWFVGAGMSLFLLGYERCKNGPHPLRPKRINERFAYFAGAGAAYLASVPIFLGEDEIPSPPSAYPSAPVMPAASPAMRPPSLPPDGG